MRLTIMTLGIQGHGLRAEPCNAANAANAGPADARFDDADAAVNAAAVNVAAAEPV